MTCWFPKPSQERCRPGVAFRGKSPETIDGLYSICKGSRLLALGADSLEAIRKEKS
jgi:hypothetical protein